MLSPYRWWVRGNVVFKPGVHKPWCLLSSNWVGLGNAGRQQFSKKVHNRHYMFELPKKKLYLPFKCYYLKLSMTYTKPIKCAGVWQPLCGHAHAQHRGNVGQRWIPICGLRMWQTCWLVEPVAHLRVINGHIWSSRGTVIGWEHSSIQTSPLQICSPQISPEH